MKKLIIVVLSLCILLCSSCAEQPDPNQNNVKTIDIRFADAEEGIRLLLSNEEFYSSFSQNDLDYRLQKKDATLEEYIEFAKKQVLEFTEEEKALVTKQMDYINARILEKGIMLPQIDEIVFVNTTGAEHCYPSAYTMGTSIFVNSYVFNICQRKDVETVAFTQSLLLHELFHCLTRMNPQFRSDMYSLIGFTVQDEDFTIPPSAMDYYISNPDVEHHNASARFMIDGKEVECFLAMASKRFEEKGDNFFGYTTTILIPVDGTDAFYTIGNASNFYDIFGKSTDYVTDPEEYLADCFSYAIIYGEKGPNGVPYDSKEISDIYAYLTTGPSFLHEEHS